MNILHTNIYQLLLLTSSSVFQSGAGSYRVSEMDITKYQYSQQAVNVGYKRK